MNSKAARARAARALVVALIVFLAVFNYVDRAILVPNQEFVLMDLLGISRAEAASRTVMIGGLHTIFKWSAAGFTILYGFLNDRFSRKKILVAGALAYGMLTLATFLVVDYSQLVAVTILTAVAIGASLPTSYSILSDMFPRKSRGRVFGLFGISTIAGDILGNLLVSVIFPPDDLNVATWRQPFLLVGLTNIVLAAMLMVFLKEPKRGAKEEYLSGVVAREGVEYSYRIRLKDLAEVVKVKSNRWIVFNFVDNMTGGYMLATAIPWLEEHGTAREIAGILVLFPAIGILAGTLFFGWVGDMLFKKDKRGRVMTCIACVAVSFVLLPIAASIPFDLGGLDLGGVLTSPQFFLVISVFMVFFFFNNGIGPHWHATIIDVNKVETRGSILSIAIFFEEFGEGLGILFGSMIHDAVLSYSLTWVWLTVFMVGGFLFWLPLYRNVKGDIERVDAINKERAEMIEKSAGTA